MVIQPTLDFGGLRAQSQTHHDKYQADRERDLEDLFGTNPEQFQSLPGGYTGALNALRNQLGMQRAQANFNAPWDAWYQAVGNATNDNPVIRGLRRVK